MPAYRDITHCVGHNVPICEHCFRRICPVPAGKMVSNGNWTPNTKGRGWCEGYMKEPKR